MSTSHQRKARRKRSWLKEEARLKRLGKANEQHWRTVPEIGAPIKAKAKGAAKVSFRTVRTYQYTKDQIDMPAPGVKIRGKIGPSGTKSYKTWLRKDEL